jgi:hypothetical protein
VLKKILAAAATLLLGAGLSTVVASPAVAADARVTGTAVCNPTLGTYDITWHVQGTADFANATATIVSARQSGVEITTTPSLVGVTASGASFTDGVQQDVAPGYYRLDVKVSWSNGADSGVFSTSGAVTASAAACVATAPVPPATADPTVIHEVGAYVYKKLDPSANASGGNSGPQLLLEVREGTSWFEPTVALPAYVCGPGWAVQEDAVAYTAGSFQWPTILNLQHGITIGAPLYASKHFDLDDVMTVPECVEDPTIPTSAAWDARASVTQPSCAPTGIVSGSIGVQFPSSAPTAVRYFIDRNLATERELTLATTALNAGTYAVTAEPRDPQHTVLSPAQWTLTIGNAPTLCAELPTLPLDPPTQPFDPPTLAFDPPTLALPTLAYTGLATGGALTLAGGLLTIGLVALIAARRRTATLRNEG